MNAPESQCGADVAAYALGALDAAEVDRMRRHLDSCAVCLEELAAFQIVADDLAASPERLTAPPALRRRVLGEVIAEPRLRSSARRRRVHLSLPIPRLTPAFAAGLATVLVALVAGAFALSSGSGHTHVVTAQVSGRGAAALHVTDHRGELVVRRFPAAPRGKIYEVWLQSRTGALRPTSALFAVNRVGDGDVDVPGSLRGVTHVLVTPEPAGGSTHPTSAPVIRVGV